MPKSVSRAVLGTMQFALYATYRTPHGASRLVHAISAWLVKTRRAPSRDSRDARVYGHTATAMHKLSIPSPPPPTARLEMPPQLASYRKGKKNLSKFFMGQAFKATKGRADGKVVGESIMRLLDRPEGDDGIDGPPPPPPPSL